METKEAFSPPPLSASPFPFLRLAFCSVDKASSSLPVNQLSLHHPVLTPPHHNSHQMTNRDLTG
jgi:hypothetical protein